MQNKKTEENNRLEVVKSDSIEPGDYVPKVDVVELVKDFLIKMEGLQNMIRDGKEVLAHNKAQGIKDKLSRVLRYLNPEENKNDND